jgi:hypothetical protein
VEDIPASLFKQILAEITAFQYALLWLDICVCDIGGKTRTITMGNKGTIPNGFCGSETIHDKSMASRILSKSTINGVKKRRTEPNNVLGASVHGSSIFKQVILGFQ